MSDPAAIPIEELLRRRADVRRFVRYLARDEEDALELEQEGWVRLLERPPASNANSVGWFRQVVHRLAIDRERKRSRRECSMEAPGLEEQPTDELVERLELDQRVGQAVLELPPTYREVVLLAFWDGLGPAAIAKRLDRPVESVRTQLRRGLERLREKLDRTYGDRAAWAALAGVSELVPIAGAAVGGIVVVTAMKKLAVVVGIVLVVLVAREVLVGSARPEPVDVSASGSTEAQPARSMELAPQPLSEAPIVVEPVTRTVVATPDEAGRGSVALGRVVDEFGAPLIGIAVELRSWDAWDFELALEDEASRDGLLGASGRSDARGEFRLEVPSQPRSDPFLRFLGDDHREQRLIMFRPPAEASVPESARGRQRFAAFAVGEQNVGDVVLRGAAAIRLRAVRADGHSLGEAIVRICERPGGVFGRSFGIQARTGDDGFVTLGHLLEDEVFVCLEHRTHVSRNVGPFELIAGHTLDVGDVVLEPSPVIAGVVVDEAGEPVPDAWVVGAPYKGGRHVRLQANGVGEFEMPLVEAGAYRLQTVHPESIDRPDGQNQGPFLPGTRDVRLVLETRETFSLLVRDGATRAPIEAYRQEEFQIGNVPPGPGLKQLPRAYGRDYSYRMRDGEFEEHIAGRSTVRVTTSERGLAISAAGYQRWFGRLSLEQSTSPVVADLVPVRTLTGRVVAGEDSARHAHVVLTTTEMETMFATPVAAIAGDDGRFVLRGVSDGAHRLEVNSPQGDFFATALVVDSDADLETIAISPGALVTGRVLVPEGRDPTELEVRLCPPDDLNPASRKTARVDHEGRFGFPPVEPRRYEVLVKVPEYDSTAWSQPPPETILAVAGESNELELDLTEFGTAPAHVTIEFATGPAPPGGIHLWAQTDHGEVLVGYLGSSGEVRGLLPAPTTVLGFEIRAGEFVTQSNTEPFVTILDERVECALSLDVVRLALDVELPSIELTDLYVRTIITSSKAERLGSSGPMQVLYLTSLGGYSLDAEEGLLTTPPLPPDDYSVTIEFLLRDEQARALSSLGEQTFEAKWTGAKVVIESARSHD